MAWLVSGIIGAMPGLRKPASSREVPHFSSTVSGLWPLARNSPWPGAFPPSAPPQATNPALFADFHGTTHLSDFSCPYITGYGSSPSRCGPCGASCPSVGHETSQVPTWSFQTWSGLRPRRSVSASHNGAAHFAFDYSESLGLREFRYFVAQSHSPHDRCVRFVVPVAGHHATLASGRALPLTHAGLPPAGSRQLRLALHCHRNTPAIPFCAARYRFTDL